MKSIGKLPKSKTEVGTKDKLAEGYVIDLFSSDRLDTQSVLDAKVIYK
jgi:hypothetical protein